MYYPKFIVPNQKVESISIPRANSIVFSLLLLYLYNPCMLFTCGANKNIITNRISVRKAKAKISLGIRPVLSESLLCDQWVTMDTSFLRDDSKDSDQTELMDRLI